MATPEPRQDHPALVPATSTRHLILGGMTASVVVAYLARTVLAPAGSVIQDELRLSNLEMGAIHGIWAFGYVGFQLPGAWLGNRLGLRVVLPIYGLVWSLCTFWTAGAATFSGLWWSRLLFGGAQAGLIPCLTRACVEWFPESRRGSASAALTAGMSLGAVAASGLAAFLVPWLGWRITCRLFALTGIAWAIEFWLTFRDRPETHPWVNAAELSLIRADHRTTVASEAIAAEPVPSARPIAHLGRLGLYGTLAFWLLTGQGICRTFCYNFLTSWFPTFLERAHGVKLSSAGLMTMAPLAGVVVGSVGGGYLIDELLRRTNTRRISRCGVGAGGLALGAMGFLAAIVASTPASALIILALGTTSMGLAAPATWAVTMDLGGSRSSASVMAVANMAGNLGAFLCPVAVGAILDTWTGRWDIVLLMFAAVSGLGALCWTFIDPDASREDSSRARSRTE
jgi:MFS family permease